MKRQHMPAFNITTDAFHPVRDSPQLGVRLEAKRVPGIATRARDGPSSGPDVVEESPLTIASTVNSD